LADSCDPFELPSKKNISASRMWCRFAHHIVNGPETE
jgi:hypothetical protein